ncbi:RNase A-like domain-containing protein [Streptomyces sp. NPDC054961]
MTTTGTPQPAAGALPSGPALAVRAAAYPDRETAQWATQQVVNLNEQVIQHWLARPGRQRLVIEAAWPARPDPVGVVQLRAMMLAGMDATETRAARVILKRDGTTPHGFVVHSTFPIYL